MPRLTAAEEFLAEEEPLELPYRGKAYRVPALNAERWVRFHALDAVGLALRQGRTAVEEDVALVGSLSQSDVMRVSLGDTFDELVADDVPPAVLIAASRAASAFHRHGLAAAERAWEAALAGGAKAPTASSPPAPSPQA